MSVLFSIASSRKRSQAFTYKSIPPAVVLSDTHTLVQATTGNGIQIGDLGGKVNFLVSGNYPFMQFNVVNTDDYALTSLVDDEPANWSIIGSPSPNDYSLDCINAVHGLSLYRLRFEGSDNLIKWPGSDAIGPLKEIYVENCILQDGGFASFLINQDVVGDEYGNVTFIFCRVLRSGGESWYLGNTGGSQQFFRGITTVTNCYSEDSGREALQFNGHADVRVTNFTAYNAGLDTGSGIGQNNGFQLQNVGTGYFKKCIFWNCRAAAMIACQDFLFEDCFFGWTESDRAIFFQDMSANGYLEFENHGGTVRFRRCTFYNPNLVLSYIMHIQEEECNLVFEDCIFPAAATDIWDDQRSATPYSLSETGSTFTDSPPLPTFGNPPESEYIGFERVVTDAHWHGRHVGFRSNPNDL